MAATLTYNNRAFSIGPTKRQGVDYSVLSTDTSAVLTMPALHIAESCMVGGGLQLVAAPTFLNNTVTLTFAAPGTFIFGTIYVDGK